MTQAKPKGFTFVHATSGGEGARSHQHAAQFHYAMIAEDISDLPGKTIARTIRNQHPDTVVLTFLGPSDNGQVELVETHGHAHARQAVHRGQAAARPPRRARRGVAGQGARAPLHPGVPRAALRLPAPLRRAQDEDRSRDHRRSGLTAGDSDDRDGVAPLIVAARCSSPSARTGASSTRSRKAASSASAGPSSPRPSAARSRSTK